MTGMRELINESMSAAMLFHILLISVTCNLQINYKQWHSTVQSMSRAVKIPDTLSCKLCYDPTNNLPMTAQM